MHRNTLASAVLSVAALLLSPTPVHADVTFVAPGVAGSVTNLTVDGNVYDVAFVGNVSHTAWASQLDFTNEDDAEAAVAAVAAELNAVGGVTSLRFTTTSSTFDHNVGQLWYASDTTSLFGETLIRSGSTWQLAFPFPGGSTAPLNGAFPFALDFTLVSASPWVDVGGATSGVSGDPELSGSGTLAAGDPVTLELSNAKPNSTSVLLIGVTLLDAPFKGGVLVPSPDIVVMGIPTDGSGGHVLDFNWPAGIPSATQFWVQEWIADPAGPFGYSASNGLQGTTP